jgi:hypothetical protein
MPLASKMIIAGPQIPGQQLEERVRDRRRDDRRHQSLVREICRLSNQELIKRYLRQLER